MEKPCVRFDDLSPGGFGSFGLLDPAGSMEARRLDDVIPAMEQAEEAARDGLWVAGYVTYEAASAFNPLLTVRPPGLHEPMRELPLARFDTYRKRIPLDEIESTQFPVGEYNVSAWSADSSQDDYRRDLASIGRSIMAGEISQLTHTFRLHAAFSGDPAALYGDLLLSQRGPHAACLDVERFRIASASPTGFFRRKGNTITVRPVLESARRGRWLGEDRQLAELLRVRGGERYTNRLVVKEVEAELAELGELLCGPGSKRFSLERLETLWYLTTELSATVPPETGLVDMFSALFPSVSVTGVPKVEAMELIATTEDTARGIYCGAIGFLAPSEGQSVDADFNVAVRTVVIDEDEGVAEFGVGTAITTRSDVEVAYESARMKAKVLVERRPDFRLKESFRCEAGIAQGIDEKVRYLADSAEYFGYEMDPTAVTRNLSEAADTQDENCILTAFVDRDGGIQIEVSPASVWQDGPGGLDVFDGVVAVDNVSSDNIYLFHKTTNCRVAAAMSLEYPDADVVIICNERDEPVGAIRGNLVALVDGRWLTPPLECGSTPTAFRKRLIDSGDVVERVFDRAQLLAAAEIGVLDDAHGWRTLVLDTVR
ncbi:MAG: chorismate-binding protein [Actinomycetota bacterium]|nr:chorismate-binding protein [Actinomycetota bacterium]